jgi:phosphoenolpyruvate carboxylase
VIQAELLKRYRAATLSDNEKDKEETKILQNALLITINGIANGMRNSG